MATTSQNSHQNPPLPTPSFVFTNESKIDEELKCPICYEIYPPDAVSCHSCTNAFCKTCVETQQRCPLCRMDLRPLQKISLPLRNILAKLNVDCLACSKTAMPRGDFEYHVQHYCPIACPYGCDKKITRASLSNHENECLQKLLPCSSADLGCSCQIPRAKIAAHGSECPYVLLAPTLTRQKKEIRELLNVVVSQNKRIRDLESEVESAREHRSVKRQKITRTNTTDFSGSSSEYTNMTNSGSFPIVSRQHTFTPPSVFRPAPLTNNFGDSSEAWPGYEFQELEEIENAFRSAAYPILSLENQTKPLSSWNYFDIPNTPSEGRNSVSGQFFRNHAM